MFLKTKKGPPFLSVLKYNKSLKYFISSLLVVLSEVVSSLRPSYYAQVWMNVTFFRNLPMENSFFAFTAFVPFLILFKVPNLHLTTLREACRNPDNLDRLASSSVKRITPHTPHSQDMSPKLTKSGLPLGQSICSKYANVQAARKIGCMGPSWVVRTIEGERARETKQNLLSHPSPTPQAQNLGTRPPPHCKKGYSFSRPQPRCH